MRVSVDKDDPGYKNFPTHRLCKVYLDGAELKNCITADEEEGEVLCYVEDENGELVLTDDGEAVKTEIRHGAVTIGIV